MRLKKITKHLFLLFIFTSPVYSDVPFGFKGIKGGATFSNFYDINSDHKQGYLFGIFGEKALIENASLSWEVIFVNRGGILRDAPTITDGTSPQTEMYTYDIHCSVRFLEIPVYLKVAIPLTENISVFLLSGPSISSARKDFSSLENKKTYKGTQDEYYGELIETEKHINYDAGSYSSNRLDKSLRLGFNWGIGFKYRQFSIESRYSTLYQDLGHLGNIYRVDLRTYSIQFILNVNLINSKP